VVCALQDAADPTAKSAVRKGSEFLAKLVKPDGSIDGGDGGLDYPVYTAALAVVALSHKDNTDLLKARAAWLKYLLDRQLTEKHGWKPADKEYGGWGYCRLVPTKPEPDQFRPATDRVEPVRDGLRPGGGCGPPAWPSGRVYDKALVFVRRCQNEDGGFHFIYDDPVRNKAGSPDPPPANPTRFHSYGSNQPPTGCGHSSWPASGSLAGLSPPASGWKSTSVSMLIRERTSPSTSGTGTRCTTTTRRRWRRR